MTNECERWRELVDYAVDAGQVVPSFTTRREAAVIVSVPNATLLAQRADAAVFSGGEPTDDEVASFWREVGEAKESLRGDLGLVDRVKAAVSLMRSVVPRVSDAPRNSIRVASSVTASVR